MSTNVPTSESLKEKAKVIRKFLNEKINVDISHGHSLELVSKIFGFNDWNTASAASNPKPTNLPAQIRTVGEMKKALDLFEDSLPIDANYEFSLKEFLDDVDPMSSEDGTIHQEFSLVLEKHDSEFASFRLKIEDESISFPR